MRGQLAGPALDEKGLACADPSGDQVPHREGVEHALAQEPGVVAQPLLDGESELVDVAASQTFTHPLLPAGCQGERPVAIKVLSPELIELLGVFAWN